MTVDILITVHFLDFLHKHYVPFEENKQKQTEISVFGISKERMLFPLKINKL
jgi:hypothetical protein